MTDITKIEDLENIVAIWKIIFQIHVAFYKCIFYPSKSEVEKPDLLVQCGTEVERPVSPHPFPSKDYSYDTVVERPVSPFPC